MYLLQEYKVKLKVKSAGFVLDKQAACPSVWMALQFITYKKVMFEWKRINKRNKNNQIVF